MPSSLNVQFSALINRRAYAVLQTPRRNAGNTGWEWGTPVWSDGSYTDPSWLASIPHTKVTGLGTAAQQNSTAFDSAGAASAALSTALAAVALAVPSQTGNSGKFLTTNGTATSWAVVSVPVSSVSNSDGTLTVTPTAGAVVASLALGHANTWTGQQTFADITVAGRGTTFTPISADNFVINAASSGDRLLVMALNGTAYWHWDLYGAGTGNLSFADSGGADWRLSLKRGGGVGINIDGALVASAFHVSSLGPSIPAQVVRAVASQSAPLVQLQGVSSTTDGREMANVDAVWATPTDATRKARLVLSAYDTAAREGVRVEASGSEAMLGFYGTAAIARQLFATGAGHTVDELITALQNLGLLKQS